MRFLAGFTHLAIYGALIAIPLQGWLLTNLRSMKVSVLGLGHLPTILAPDSEAADAYQDWHIYLASFLGALVATHILAAL